MFTKFLHWLNGGDPRSHSEPNGQLDYWDRGIVPIAGAQFDGFHKIADTWSVQKSAGVDWLAGVRL